MITYKVLKKDKQLIELLIEGHALFADYGNDIVCSSVSTAAILTANAITHLGYKENVLVKYSEGNFKIRLNKFDEVPFKLIQNLEIALDDLANQYPKNIKRSAKND